MKKDIRLQYSKKEDDLEVSYELGHETTAKYILDLLSKKVQQELEARGYDLKTIQFSISKKMSKYIMIDGESVDEELTYVNKHYKMDLKKGQRVSALGKAGIVLGGTNYVWLKHGESNASYHPQDIRLIIAKPSQKTGENNCEHCENMMKFIKKYNAKLPKDKQIKVTALTGSEGKGK